MEEISMQGFRPDEVIMQEGKSYDEMYKIVSGSVVVYMHYGEKEEHVLGIYSQSQCFGEANVLSNQPATYTVVAYDEVLLLRITKDHLEEFVRSNPGDAIELMQNMVETNRLMQTHIDLLLDDLYEKQDINEKRTGEIKRKIRQYNAYGINLSAEQWNLSKGI